MVGAGDHSERIEGLEGRNVVDDRRQDESDARQERTEQHVAEVHETISEVKDTVVTLRDVYNIADKRMDRLERLCEAVTRSTEHRLTRYEKWVLQVDQRVTEWMSRMEGIITSKASAEALAQKADKNQLITSIVFRWLNISWVRWVTGVLFLAIFTTAATQHWFVWAANWVEGFYS